jgi:pilus assembly protein CpaC
MNVSGLIDALEQEGLVTVLAEPNLTALSGETATFLSGGEFPVPVPQGLQEITIEWKRFGVSVEFTPTVLDPNRLSIKVKPEVSELTDTGSVVINGTQIPALAVRRAETTVELASGQSFAIAGLFQNNGSNQLQQLPWLGDLPVLGALFRSTRFQHSESELVIIVTPYIVQPTAKTSDLRVPTEGLVFASDLERVLLGRLTTAHAGPGGSGAGAETPHLTGAAGFMLERQ